MLEGRLEEFNFGEILKLAAQTKKTGVIVLKRDDGAEGKVYLRDGYIYFAESNRRKKPIGEMLIESGKITRNQLQTALEEQKKLGNAVRLGMILMDKGFITPQDLVSVVQDQITETIFQFFEWDKGKFAFLTGIEAENEDIGIKLDIENAIIRGSEKIKHWESLKRFVGGLDTVFAPQDVYDEDKVIVLRPRELKILRLIGPGKKLREIIKESQMDEFELYRLLFALTSAGLIKKENSEKAGSS